MPVPDYKNTRLTSALYGEVLPALIKYALRTDPSFDGSERGLARRIRISRVVRAAGTQERESLVATVGEMSEWRFGWRLWRVLRKAHRTDDLFLESEDTGNELVRGIRRWCRVVLAEGIRPALRSEIAAMEEAEFGVRLVLPADSALENPKDTVLTASDYKLLATIRRMRGTGSIGLAGPRGAGKSTMLDTYVSRRIYLRRELTRTNETEILPALTVSTAAPSRYEPKEFILHLLACLCRAVINEVEPRSGRPGSFRPWWRRIAAVARQIGLLLSYGALLAISLLFIVDFDDVRPIWQQIAQPAGDLGLRVVPIYTIGAYAVVRIVHDVLQLVSAMVATVFGWLSTLLERLVRRVDVEQPRSDQALQLCKEAARLLLHTRILQTRITGVSGKLPLPARTEAGWTRTVQSAEQPLTHPEIVEHFREFAVQCVAVFGRIAIGVDELDKITSTTGAESFLNDIKGIFGVDGCLYLISVSEDALAAFERRGAVIRDVFDSSFDEIVHVDHLELDDSSELLQNRMPGLPAVFRCLCHCVAGGLPRELIRVARHLATYGVDNQPAVSVVCHGLVGSELRSRVHGIRVATARLGVDYDVSDLLRQLMELGRGQTAAELLPFARKLCPPQSGDGALTALDRVRWEAAMAAYFYATVLEVFTDSLTRPLIESLFDEKSSLVEQLARGGSTVAESPQVAWILLNDFRASWGLETFDRAFA